MEFRLNIDHKLVVEQVTYGYRVTMYENYNSWGWRKLHTEYWVNLADIVEEYGLEYGLEGK